MNRAFLLNLLFGMNEEFLSGKDGVLGERGFPNGRAFLLILLF